MPAIEELARECARDGVAAGVTLEGAPRALSDPIEFTLFRAAQEALTNGRRHAHASRVSLSLAFAANERVRLRVEDDPQSHPIRAWVATAPAQPSDSYTERPGTLPRRETARANAAMLRYANGDDAAFRELYALLAPRLYRLCRWLCPAEASELFQEVFLKIHRARATFVDSGSVFAWSAAIACKTHVDLVRYRARRSEAALPANQLELWPSHGTPSPKAPLLQRELEREVERELGLLSDTLRVAYNLVKVRGQSYADASVQLGAPIDAIKQRVHRASEELRAGVTLFVNAC